MTYDDMWRRLAVVYGVAEAKAVVRTLLEDVFSMTLTDICCGKVTQLSAKDNALLEKMMVRLEKAEPVQYVTGKAFFAGRFFHVEPGVLIPRPETEQLCNMAVDALARCEDSAVPRLLDIGTGSGCIAVTVAAQVHRAEVTAWDISPTALAVATRNAEALHTMVRVQYGDALHAPADKELWDVVVSNPPYVCISEQKAMAPNVTRYEPSEALYVPDSDPLLFYRAITAYAVSALRPGGSLLFEINPRFAGDMEAIVADAGMEKVRTVPDMYGRQRFTISCKPL